jgi:hypothetical protein
MFDLMGSGDNDRNLFRGGEGKKRPLSLVRNESTSDSIAEYLG